MSEISSVIAEVYRYQLLSNDDSTLCARALNHRCLFGLVAVDTLNANHS